MASYARGAGGPVVITQASGSSRPGSLLDNLNYLRPDSSRALPSAPQRPTSATRRPLDAPQKRDSDASNLSHRRGNAPATASHAASGIYAAYARDSNATSGAYGFSAAMAGRSSSTSRAPPRAHVSASSTMPASVARREPQRVSALDAGSRTLPARVPSITERTLTGRTGSTSGFDYGLGGGASSATALAMRRQALAAADPYAPAAASGSGYGYGNSYGSQAQQQAVQQQISSGQTLRSLYLQHYGGQEPGGSQPLGSGSGSQRVGSARSGSVGRMGSFSSASAPLMPPTLQQQQQQPSAAVQQQQYLSGYASPYTTTSLPQPALARPQSPLTDARYAAPAAQLEARYMAASSAGPSAARPPSATYSQWQATTPYSQASAPPAPAPAMYTAAAAGLSAAASNPGQAYYSPAPTFQYPSDRLSALAAGSGIRAVQERQLQQQPFTAPQLSLPASSTGPAPARSAPSPVGGPALEARANGTSTPAVPALGYPGYTASTSYIQPSVGPVGPDTTGSAAGRPAYTYGAVGHQQYEQAAAVTSAPARQQPPAASSTSAPASLSAAPGATSAPRAPAAAAGAPAAVQQKAPETAPLGKPLGRDRDAASSMPQSSASGSGVYTGLAVAVAPANSLLERGMSSPRGGVASPRGGAAALVPSTSRPPLSSSSGAAAKASHATSTQGAATGSGRTSPGPSRPEVPVLEAVPVPAITGAARRTSTAPVQPPPSQPVPVPQAPPAPAPYSLDREASGSGSSSSSTTSTMSAHGSSGSSSRTHNSSHSDLLQPTSPSSVLSSKQSSADALGSAAGAPAPPAQAGAAPLAPLPELPVPVVRGSQAQGRGCVGLNNLGNTCFMNSILQSLNAIPELVYHFTNPPGSWAPKALVAPAYSGLVKDMSGGPLGACVNPSTFLRKISKHDSRWGDGSQQDSQEFLHSLLEALQVECNRVVGKPKYKELAGKGPEEEQAEEAHSYARSWNDSVVDDIFGGLLQSTIQCQVCKRQSHCFDPFLDLAVPIPSPGGGSDSGRSPAKAGASPVSVADCMRAFVAQEQLEGADSYKCEVCKRCQPHTKRLQIYRPPRVLVLTLKRFASRGSCSGGLFSSFRFGRSGTTKNSAPVVLEPEPLDLAPYCNPLGLQGAGTGGRPLAATYQLVAVSHHSGSLEGGHYTAQARSLFDGSWYNFNDSNVRREAGTPGGASSSAYVLFYRMVGLPSSTL